MLAAAAMGSQALAFKTLTLNMPSRTLGLRAACPQAHLSSVRETGRTAPAASAQATVNMQHDSDDIAHPGSYRYRQKTAGMKRMELGEERLSKMREIFNSIDKDGSGSLEESELHQAMRQMVYMITIVCVFTNIRFNPHLALLDYH